MQAGANNTSSLIEQTTGLTGQVQTESNEVISVEKNVPADMRSSYANTELQGKTPQQQQTLVSFLSSVNEKIKNMAREIRDNPNSKFRRERFSKVTARQANDIENLTGIDTSEFQHGINTNAFKHIEQRHGLHGEHDSSMADLNDVARIPFVVENYDKAELVYETNGKQTFSNEFRNKNNSPVPLIKYTKAVDGTMYVVEAVPDSEYKTLWVVTAYMNKKTGGIPVSDASAATPNSTSETELVPSPVNPTIPQNGDGVNTQSMQVGAVNTSVATPSLIEQATGWLRW